MQIGILENVAILDFPLIKKREILIRYKFFLGAFWIICVSSVISLFVFCIFQINAEISARYSVSQYKTQLDEALDKNSALETKSLSTNSISNVASLVENLNFEKVVKINYIKSVGRQVVSK